MALSYDEFTEIFNNKSEEITGAPPSVEQTRENYYDYVALVDFTGKDGELIFEGSGSHDFTWDFKPFY